MRGRRQNVVLSVFDCFDHRFHGWHRWTAGWIVEICVLCVICGCLSRRALGVLRGTLKDLAGKFEPAGREESRDESGASPSVSIAMMTFEPLTSSMSTVDGPLSSTDTFGWQKSVLASDGPFLHPSIPGCYIPGFRDCTPLRRLRPEPYVSAATIRLSPFSLSRSNDQG